MQGFDLLLKVLDVLLVLQMELTSLLGHVRSVLFLQLRLGRDGQKFLSNSATLNILLVDLFDLRVMLI